MTDDTRDEREFNIGLIPQTGDFMWKCDNEAILMLTREGVVGYGMNVVPPEGPGEMDTYRVFVTLASGGAVSHDFSSESQADQCLEAIVNWRTRH